MSRLRRKFELIIIMVIALIFIGCMNDMQHQGNWSSPVIEKDVIIVPSNEGKIHKYFISQNSFDLVYKYPQADIKIGSFYGDISIVDGVAYGISYGSDEGDKCQNKSCISYLFAVNIEDMNSIWPLDFIQIDGAIVGGIVHSKENIYFATSENDSFNEKGGFFYSVNSKNGEIQFKIPMKDRIYNSITINDEENIAIIGDTAGKLSVIDIDKNSELISKNRILSSVETNYSIISPAIHVSSENSKNNYCVGNINGDVKCFKLNINNNYTLTEWASVSIDGWIWSDIEKLNDSFFVISLSSNLYKINFDVDDQTLEIVWEQNIDKKGKPVSGILINNKSNLINGIIPFDKDKIIIAELNNGSIIDELPFKDGVQSLPAINEDFIYFIDKENKFRTFSLIDRSQKLCFDLKEMKGCD